MKRKCAKIVSKRGNIVGNITILNIRNNFKLNNKMGMPIKVCRTFILSHLAKFVEQVFWIPRRNIKNTILNLSNILKKTFYLKYIIGLIDGSKLIKSKIYIKKNVKYLKKDEAVGFAGSSQNLIKMPR
jgi:hypothetical protein